MTVGHDNWLSPAQAARVLGVTPQRVRQMTNEGRLRCQWTPLGRMIDFAAVEALRTERARKAGSTLGENDV